MTAVQLEFNIENKSDEELRFDMMQKQIDAFCDSMGKVRKKLFAEQTELKKLCAKLHAENQQMKDILDKIHHEKIEWVYAQDGCLFDVRKPEEAESQRG